MSLSSQGLTKLLAVAGGTGVLAYVCRVHSLPQHVTVAVAVTSMSVGVLMAFVPPKAQDPAYHDFADKRPLRLPCMTIPNCMDVLSNIPFLVGGALGLRLLLVDTHLQELHVPEFHTPFEAYRAWPVFFVGVGLTSIGSAYYHWAPTNETLVWDRLPMTIGFMSLFAIILEERLGHGIGEAVFLPFLVAGFGSVFYWHHTEQQKCGDLRPYLIVQFLPLMSIPILFAVYPATYTRSSDQLLALFFYLLAKITEVRDKPILRLTGGVVSGHTLKHLFAALAPITLALSLGLRHPL